MPSRVTVNMRLFVAAGPVAAEKEEAGSSENGSRVRKDAFLLRCSWFAVLLVIAMQQSDSVIHMHTLFLCSFP